MPDIAVITPKPGYKTTEFWFTLASQLAVVWGGISGLLPPKIASMISIAGVALYTVARTVAKSIADVQAAKAASGMSAPISTTSMTSTTRG